MNKEKKVWRVQQLTNDYCETANLLDLTYEEVREICEKEEDE